MPQPDGSIIIDTQLDTQGFKAGSVEMGKAINSFKSKVNSMQTTFISAMNGSATATQKLKGKSEELRGEVTRLESEMQKLGNTRIPTEDYQFAKQMIEKTEQELEKLEEKQAKMQATGVKRSSSAWRNLQYEIDYAKQRLETYKNDAEGMENSGTAYRMGSDTSEYQRIAEELRWAKESLHDMSSSTFSLRSGAEKVAGGFSKAYGYAKRIGSTVTRIGSTLMGAVRRGVSTLASKLKNAKSEADGTRKKLLKMGLALIGMRGLMAGIRQLVSSALNNNDKLKNQLTALKGVLGTALTPAMTFLVNALTKVVTLADQVYQLFAGTSLIAQYNAAQTAKMAKETAKAAKNAKKYKNQLASFDTLNVLSDNSSDKDSNSDSESALFNPSKIKLGKGVTDYLKKLKAAFKKGDYKEVGRIIAGGINKALKSIKWGEIQKTCEKIAKNIGNFINGFVGKFDWKLLGRTIGNAINTLTITLHTLAVTVDWGKIGKSIADTFNSTIRKIDWGLIGQTLAELINIPIHFAENFAYTFKWGKFGKSLSTAFTSFVSTIDLSSAARGLSRILKGVAKTAQELFRSPGWGKFGAKLRETLTTFFNNKPFSNIASTVRNALSALMDAGIELFKGGKAAKAFGTDVGQAIHDWFCDSEWWKKLGNLLSDLALSITDFAVAVIDEVSLEDIENAITSLLSGINWGAIAAKLGEGIAKGLVKGLYKAIRIIVPDAAQAFDAMGLTEDAVNKWVKDNMTLDTERAEKLWNNIGEGRFEYNDVDYNVSQAGFKLQQKLLKKTGISYQKWEKILDGVGLSYYDLNMKISESGKTYEQLVKSIKNSGYSYKQIGKILKNGTSEQKKALIEALANGDKIVIKGVKKIASSVEGEGKTVTKKAKDAAKASSKAANDGFKSQKFDATGKKVGNDYKKGISSTKGVTQTAAKGVSKSANVGLASADTKQTGAKAGAKYTSGIKTTAVSAKSTATNVAKTANTALGSPDYKATGKQSGKDFKSGFASVKSETKTAGNSVGANIIAGIKAGIKTAWNSFIDFWKERIGGVIDTAKSILGIHSPSAIFKAIGDFLMRGLQNGVNYGKGKVLSAIANVAQDATERMQQGDYSITPTVNSVDGKISAFTNTVDDKVTALLNKLQTIANNVAFFVPDIALGKVVPYTVKAGGGGLSSVKYGNGSSEHDMTIAELYAALIQMFNNQSEYIGGKIDKYSTRYKVIGIREGANVIVGEINRKTRADGKSPILR